jgi:hypothetical protein
VRSVQSMRCCLTVYQIMLCADKSDVLNLLLLVSEDDGEERNLLLGSLPCCPAVHG